MAHPGEETKQLLQAKHPVRRVEIDEAVEQEVELVLLEEAILLLALWKAPRGAQPGVNTSGMLSW